MNAENDFPDENVPDASELLDFELIAKSQPEKSGGLWLWVVLVLVLAGGGWAGWMYMQDQNTDDLVSIGAEGAPMILAPKFAIKEKPSDPGGMRIPDRDKVVYDRMNGKDTTDTAGQVERLLPPPESPIDPPNSTPIAPEQPPKTVTVTKADATPAPPPAPSAPDNENTRSSEPSSTPSVETDPQPVAKAPPEPKPEPEPTPQPQAQASAPQPSPQATGTPGQGYMIQLSAVRNEASAKGEWARLAKKHADILGGLQMVIQRADLGAKGVFYRVRGGWFATRGEAKAVCDALEKRNVGCLIAKP